MTDYRRTTTKRQRSRHTSRSETQPPGLMWNPSRDRAFRACPRSFYLKYYAPYAANAPDEPLPRSLLRALASGSSSAILVGNIVHKVAGMMLANAADDAWKPSTLHTYTRRVARSEMRGARRTRNHLDAFGEQYPTEPQDPLDAEAFVRILDRAWELVQRLHAHPIIAACLEHPERVISVERRVGFVHEGIDYAATPDLVWRQESGELEVVEWKTGSGNGPEAKEVQLQLESSAVCVTHGGLPGDTPQEIGLRAVWLGSGQEDRTHMGPNELAHTMERIQASAAAMRRCLRDPAANIAQADAFARVADTETSADFPEECRRCPFVSVCRT